MEYRIFTSKSFIDLETTINNQLKNGWELQGGVSVAEFTRSEMIYCQAMTKAKQHNFELTVNG
jgi:hypothetical protein